MVAPSKSSPGFFIASNKRMRSILSKSLSVDTTVFSASLKAPSLSRTILRNLMNSWKSSAPEPSASSISKATTKRDSHFRSSFNISTAFCTSCISRLPEPSISRLPKTVCISRNSRVVKLKPSAAANSDNNCSCWIRFFVKLYKLLTDVTMMRPRPSISASDITRRTAGRAIASSTGNPAFSKMCGRSSSVTYGATSNSSSM
mmetsp:Transcript_104787/g.165436  ORF Transcript_104787/g.165436 Transcript_104787/m.165436 type:complete len:202 (-) Transcript_104787:2094-2699(-)